MQLGRAVDTAAADAAAVAEGQRGETAVMQERLRAEGTALQARAATIYELQARLAEAEASSAAAVAAAAAAAAAAEVPTHELAEGALAARAAEQGRSLAARAHETAARAVERGVAAHELGVARRDAGELRREVVASADLVATLRRELEAEQQANAEGVRASTTAARIRAERDAAVKEAEVLQGTMAELRGKVAAQARDHQQAVEAAVAARMQMGAGALGGQAAREAGITAALVNANAEIIATRAAATRDAAVHEA